MLTTVRRAGFDCCDLHCQLLDERTGRIYPILWWRWRGGFGVCYRRTQASFRQNRTLVVHRPPRVVRWARAWPRRGVIIVQVAKASMNVMKLFMSKHLPVNFSLFFRDTIQLDLHVQVGNDVSAVKQDIVTFNDDIHMYKVSRGLTVFTWAFALTLRTSNPKQFFSARTNSVPHGPCVPPTKRISVENALQGRDSVL